MRPCLSVIIPLLMLLLSGCAARQAGIAAMLLDLKRDEQSKAAALSVETRNFLRAKDALLGARGKLEPYGQEQARRVFGEPVSVFRRSGRTVWAYKPGDADWFSGEKIYLTFDAQGRLASAEYQPS